MIEVDFIPVGEHTDTGDAILCRFTEPGSGLTRVVLVDGGFHETADKIVAHVETYYATSRIDLMVCTHPDEDHINGLFEVFDQLPVTELVIHRPSAYGYTSDDVKAAKVDDLIAAARRQGTIVTTTAFAGRTFFSDAITIAGPTQDYYKQLLNEQMTTQALTSKTWAVIRAAAQTVKKALTTIYGDPGENTLTDHGGTSARNNSSIVLDVQVDGWRVLLTGDAGAPALERAADQLDRSGRSSAGLPALIDIPHHGSRHNLTTAVMDRIAGPIVGATGERAAFVSVGKEADDFPRAEVANAFTRRGYNVCPTRGQTICWSRNAPTRRGWSSITPMSWVEPDE